MSIDLIILVTAVLLGLGVVASQASLRLGIPSLLFFLAIGMLAGSEGIGGIDFNNAKIAQAVGIVALAFILFSGGMDTDWHQVRPQVFPALTLATLGVVLSAGIVAFFAANILGFNILEGLLLGSIVASTDAAAVFATLRNTGMKLPPKLAAIIEIESGSNDPTAVLLTITLTALIAGTAEPGPAVAGTFFVQMAVGGVGGYLVGWSGNFILRKARLRLYALNQVVSVVIALFSYALVGVIGGNGFLAAYVAGLVFSHRSFAELKGLRRFHDGIAWIMEIAMFLVLGLLVFPSQLPDIAFDGMVLALALAFVARPLSVLVCLTPFRFSPASQVLVAWAGLRGAAPIVLATFPLVAGIDRAQDIFNIVFFVVIVSSLAQSTTLRFAPKWLRLNQPADELL